MDLPACFGRSANDDDDRAAKRKGHRGHPPGVALIEPGNARQFWFPAKRCGWGWSFPRTWQGWVMIAIYVALVVAGIFVIPAAMRPGTFIAYLVLLTLVLIAV